MNEALSISLKVIGASSVIGSLNSVKGSLKSVKTESEATKTSLSGFGTSFKVVAIGCAAVVAGLAKVISETAKTGDEIDKASQKCLMSAEAYQKWAYVMDRSGISANSLQIAMKQLTKNTDYLNNHGIAGSSYEESFDNAIAYIQGLSTETEKATAATEIFGSRVATELMPMLNMTAEDTAELKANLEAIGGVLSNTSVKGAAGFKDAITDLKKAFSGLTAQLAQYVIPFVTTLVQYITAFISLINKFLSKLGVKSNIESVFKGIEESSDTTLKNYKELKRTLIGIDELNVLPAKDDSSSAGVSTKSVSLSGELSGLGININTEPFDKFGEKLDKISEILGGGGDNDVLPLLKQVGGVAAIIAGSFSLTRLLERGMGFINDFNVSRWAADFGKEKGLSGIELDKYIKDAVKDGEFANSFRIPEFLGWMGTIAGTLGALGSTIDSLKNGLVDDNGQLNWGALVGNIGFGALAGLKFGLPGVIIGGLVGVITDAIAALKQGLEDVFEKDKRYRKNWSDSWEAARDRGFEGDLDAWKKYITDLQKQSKEVGGKVGKNLAEEMAKGFQSKRINLPITLTSPQGGTLAKTQLHLYANGGVITTPTVGIMGEYSGAKNNPEIVTPQSIMKETFDASVGDLSNVYVQCTKQLIQAIAENRVDVQIGDETIARAAARGNNSYRRMNGVSLIN